MNEPSSPSSGSPLSALRTNCAAVLMALAGLPGLAQAAARIELTPSVTAVLPGQTFSVNVAGADFASTTNGLNIDNVQGGQNLTLSFVAGLFEVLSVTIDSRWNFSSGNNPGLVNNSNGTITGLAFAAFPATADDNFNIASIQVRALAMGEGGFAVSAGQLVGRVNGLAAQSITYSAGTTSVSAVPEPHTLLLFLAGLTAVGLRKMRRRRVS